MNTSIQRATIELGGVAGSMSKTGDAIAGPGLNRFFEGRHGRFLVVDAAIVAGLGVDFSQERLDIEMEIGFSRF